MNKNKEKLLNSRYRAEKRFQFYGKSAIILALLFLTIFIFKIFSTGYTAFQKTWLVIPVTFDAETLYLDENPSIEDIEDADYFDLAIFLSHHSEGFVFFWSGSNIEYPSVRF